MTRSPAFRASRALALDVVVLAACLVPMLVELDRSEKAEPTVYGVVVLVAMSLPVLVRRQAPMWAYTLSMGLLLLLVSTTEIDIYNTIALSAVVCGYTLADRRGRRAAILTGVASAPLVVLILQVYSPHGLLTWDTARNLGLVALPLTLGVAKHDRRCYTEALVARAESAEQTREEEALRRVGEERLRIARDVHDVVAHAMVAINVQAGVGAHLLDRDPDQARATLRDIKKVSGEALGDLRSMLGLLRQDDDPAAPVLPTQGIGEIGDLREALGSAGVALDVTIAPDVEGLPASVGSTGYRIVQEALTNVMRHAGPTTARVRVTRDDDGLRELVRIEVEDDGGTSPTPLGGTGSGNGLRGMRERAAAVGGSLEAGPRDSGGWRVSATLPVAGR